MHWRLDPFTTWEVSAHTPGDSNRVRDLLSGPLRAEVCGGYSNPPVDKMWFIGNDSLMLPKSTGLLSCVCPLVCDEM